MQNSDMIGFVDAILVLLQMVVIGQMVDLGSGFKCDAWRARHL